MYERFHNLRERPFSLSPDPDYLYLSRIHREALNYLRYGLEGHAGFVVFTGDIGSGKTTLLQAALRGLDHQTSVSRLVNTQLDPRELVEAVMLDFGLDSSPDRSKPNLLRDLAGFLVEERRHGRQALLVVDEAQNLGMAALEEVRMLSNLETEKSKLIQIVLVGQPDLRETLGRPELQQLRQRVAVSYHLKALDAADAAAYIRHRLRRASIGAPVEFPPAVTDLVHRHSHGLPRQINIIADAILLFAYGEGRHGIGPDLAREVIGELTATGVIVTQADGAPTDSGPRSASAEGKGNVPSIPFPAEIEMDRAPLRFDAAEAPEPGPLRLTSPPAAPPAPAQHRIVMPPPFPIPVEGTAGSSGLWARLRRGLFSDSKPVAPVFKD